MADTKPHTPEQWREWHKLLDGAAEDCLKEHPRDTRSASKLMTEKVRSDPRLREAMLEVLVTEACTERVRRVLQQQNQASWHEGEAFDPTSRGKRLREASKTSRHYALLEYNLIGGIPLGLATRTQVESNAKFQDKQSRRMQQTALWLGLIVDRMNIADKKQIVRDLFSEEDLRKLQAMAIETVAVPAKQNATT